VRGRLHAHHGSWREDAFHWGTSGPWICIAVADGAGSAPLARVASNLVCNESIRFLNEQLNSWSPAPTAEGLSPDDVRRLRGILIGGMRAAREAIEREAERRGRPARDFHTTCLLLAHAPCGQADVVATLQVGDGVIGVRTASRCQVLGEADRGS